VSNSSHPLFELLKSAIEHDLNQLHEYDVDPAPQWIAPLNDTYRSVLPGGHELRFPDLARRTQVPAEAMGRFA